jgi:DNA-binding response OmpR family regulator
MGTQRDLGYLQRLARGLFKQAQLHVLLVDPDLASVQPLANALSRQHRVSVARTVQAARAAVATATPTLVVTELDLPDASGLELLGALRGGVGTQRILLMVLTRRTALHDKIAAFQAGADDYLVKPVDPQTFAAHVQRLGHFRQIQTADFS